MASMRFSGLALKMASTRVADRYLRRERTARMLLSFGVRDFEKLNRAGNQFAVVSAYRSELGKHANKERNGALVGDIQRMGYRRFVPQKSSWTDASGTHPEASLLVPGMSFDDAVHLMKKYNQDAIVYKDPSGTIGIYSKDHTAVMAFDEGKDIAVDVSQDEDLYSRGRSFSMGLRLVDDQTFRWSGKPLTLGDLIGQMA